MATRSFTEPCIVTKQNVKRLYNTINNDTKQKVKIVEVGHQDVHGKSIKKMLGFNA